MAENDTPEAAAFGRVQHCSVRRKSIDETKDGLEYWLYLDGGNWSIPWAVSQEQYEAVSIGDACVLSLAEVRGEPTA